MKRLGFGIPAVLLLAALLILCIGFSPVAAQDASSAQITSPASGDALFGLVNIMGTASHAEMQRYTLEFDLQDTPTDQWFTIAGPITQQVQNGILGQWNTTTVPDGRYQIRLRVVLRDGTVMESVVQNLKVSNKEPTSLPTIQPTMTLQPDIIDTSVGPTATPLIQQPPTVTPRPTVLPTMIATLTSSGGSTNANFFDQLSSACCNGALVALVITLIVAAYSTVHRRLRPLVYRLIRTFRSNSRG